MCLSMDIELILVISLSNMHAQLEKQLDVPCIFVVYLVVGFEVYEVYSHVIKSISVLHKLQLVFKHILINYAATIKLNKSICYV